MFQFLRSLFDAQVRAAKKLQKNEVLQRIFVALAETTLIRHLLRKHPVPLVFKVTTFSDFVVFCCVDKSEGFEVSVGVKVASWRKRLAGEHFHFVLKLCDKEQFEELKSDPSSGVLVL